MIETPLRPRHDLSLGWEFVRERAGRRWVRGNRSGGESVDLPHCWNRDDTFEYGRRSYSGHGAYRRTIEVPEKAGPLGSWCLRSGGFYGIGDVWLDGHRLARFDGQYLGFEIDLPHRVAAGRHLLAVRLDNRFHRNVLPGRPDPDFLLYGGLSGQVWLEWKPALHIDTNHTEVVCARGPEGTEVLELRCTVNGQELSSDNARLSWNVTMADGTQIADAGPAPVDAGPSSVSVVIQKPRCWSPDDPQLYWAGCRLETDGGTADIVRVRFGISRAEFRPRQGFFLDGERVDLHGCNRHESIPGFGNALPDEFHRRDAQILKDLGCNFVRLSHYPQSPAFLDACDELGISVYEEIATWKSVSSRRGWRRAARRQMHDLVVRDRHHPCVVLWGMGNESRSRKAYLELRGIVRNLDPLRPVIYAENHLYRARRERTTGIPDVWGVNYELDVLEEGCASSTLENVILSECCNHLLSAREDDPEELSQVFTLEREWEFMADRPYLAGHAVWSFADYATEHRNRYRRLSGLHDAWRQPKMAAELFRARYGDEPFIALFVTESGPAPPPSRFCRRVTPKGGSAGNRELHVFTNCGAVVIQRDGDEVAQLVGAIHYVLAVDLEFQEFSAHALEHCCATVRITPADSLASNRIDRGLHASR